MKFLYFLIHINMFFFREGCDAGDMIVTKIPQCDRSRGAAPSRCTPAGRPEPQPQYPRRL